MRRQVGHQAGGGDCNAAANEEGAELFERAAHPFLRGIIRRAERGADLAEVFIFKKTQKHRRAIGFGKGLNRFVQERFNVGPVRAR